MQLAARIGIELAREKNLYIVIDADGLYLLQDHPEIVKGYERAVLTPNVVEFQRLCEKMVSFPFLLPLLLRVTNVMVMIRILKRRM